MIYVTIRRGARTGLLVGPFATNDEALPWIERAIDAACAVDEFAWFDLFGTANVPGRRTPGRLNTQVGYVPPPGAAQPGA